MLVLLGLNARKVARIEEASTQAQTSYQTSSIGYRQGVLPTLLGDDRRIHKALVP